MPRAPWRDWIEYALVRAVVASVEILPDPAACRVAGGYARAFDLLAPRLRRIARRNLELALPCLDAGARERAIDGVFRSLGGVLYAFSRFPRIDRGNVGQWIRYEGYEHFEQALGRGKGVLFATAHLGNWELSAFAHALLSAPMHVVVRPLDNARIDAFVEQRRSLSGNRLIGKRSYARPILEALRKNEAVGVLVDQNVLDGVFVPFFGIPACSERSFARLAARSGAAVIPGFAVWSEEEGRYILRFDPPLPITGDADVDTATMQAKIEQVIREYPDQWLWIHRRWKTRPAGEPSLY
ncbi:MAG: lysophospholipid acyltransferase family protein [Bryobacterales bacterium]|nr:lysophospholipid acyltransferase family protein [Bryobacterales bacterium]